MAVGLKAPDRAALRPVPGCALGWAEAGIRKAGRKDLLLVRLAEQARGRGRVHAQPVLRRAGPDLSRAPGVRAPDSQRCW